MNKQDLARDLARLFLTKIKQDHLASTCKINRKQYQAIDLVRISKKTSHRNICFLEFILRFILDIFGAILDLSVLLITPRCDPGRLPSITFCLSHRDLQNEP